jgi:hypothetical protein
MLITVRLWLRLRCNRILPAHQVSVSCLLSIDEIDMKAGETCHQQPKNDYNSPEYPDCYHLPQEHVPLAFGPLEYHSTNKDGEVTPHEYYHHKECAIVFLPNAVIDPDAVMIKPTHTSTLNIGYILHILQCRV